MREISKTVLETRDSFITVREPPRFMSSKLVLIISAAISGGMLAGCATASKTPVYESNQVGQVITDQRGEIIGVQDVLIKAPSSSRGSAGAGSRIGAGAVVGAVLGNPVYAAQAAGDVIGGIVGAGADNQRGEELTILLKDGRSIVVVQERGAVPFSIGDKVKVMTGSSGSIYGGATTRVQRDEPAIIGAY
jgi:outer membrane lipoprotein SlyB